MSQRNPMNERYTQEDRTGKTRKSAASAKPVSKAAASVTVKSSKKTPEEKKAAEKAARKKEQERQRELDRKYYTPDTKRYKFLRRLWWATLVAAALVTAVSFLLSNQLPTQVSMGLIFAAYGLIVLAFYIDLSKIKKERMAYQERMIALEKQQTKAEKQATRDANTKANKGSNKKKGSRPANVKEADEAEENAEEDTKEETKPSFFGKLLGKK